MAKKMAVEELFLALIDVAPRSNATYAIIFDVLGYQAASGDLIWVAKARDHLRGTGQAFFLVG